MDYLDFGSSSDSGDDADGGMMNALDSDDEERLENKRLLQMFNLEDRTSKSQRQIQDFEAEMEAELDRRAIEIESQGGMEHQKSISRSSSTTSLNKSPRASPVPGSSKGNVKSSLKRTNSTSSGSEEVRKSVRFESTSLASTSQTKMDTNATSDTDKSKERKTYDDLYFDSDDEGDDEKKKSKRKFMTNDELFYDPNSDAKDQEWIDNQRRKSYHEKNKLVRYAKDSSTEGTTSKAANEASKSTQLPDTDAVLNCPACFTTVCHDCQRHDLYVGQYRAMFVMNCLINKQQTLKVPEKAPKKMRKNQNRKFSTNVTDNNLPVFNSDSPSDVFHPVMCKVCKTQVAMYDSDEVYHFFNVLASQP